MFNIRRLFMHAMFFAFPQTAATPAQQRKHDRQMTGAIRKPYRGRYNKYTPHQGARETLRRRIGGFAGVSEAAKFTGNSFIDTARNIDAGLRAFGTTA